MPGRPMTGLWGLLRGELGRWVGRRGLVHLVVWTVAIQGGLLLGTVTTLTAFGAFWGFDLLVHLLSLLAIPGAIMVAQSAIAEERIWGTDAWVLARPVTRGAYIVAKILGTAIPLVLISIVLQGALAYVWLPSVEPARGLTPVAPDATRYLVVLAVLSLLMLLFVVVCVALGTIFRQRAAVAGISLVIFLLFILPPGSRDALWHRWTPIGLIEGVNAGEHYKRVSEYLLGGAFDGTAGVVSAAGAVLVGTAVAVWIFRHREV